MFHTSFSSPVGTIRVTADETSLKKIELLGSEDSYFYESLGENTPLLKEAQKQIISFLKGDLKTFKLPCDLSSGTEFQQRVWRVLEEIPYGEWLSYGEVAKRVGSPKASRAIGGAANKNPLPLVIPCHRVLGSTGSLVGFAPGLAFKKRLLVLEGHEIYENSVT